LNASTENKRRRTTARLLLGGLALLAVISVGVTESPYRLGFADIERPHPPDVDGYYGAVERMRDGATYYEALGAELIGRGYPTKSQFNWRMPLPGVLIASLPNPDYGRLILGFLGACLLFFGYQTLKGMGGAVTVGLGLTLLAGPVMPGLIGILYVQPVLWAGLLVGVSAVLLGAGYRRLSIAVGVFAPFFREFAIAYVVVCLVFAVVEKRRKEAMVWAAGVAAFCIMLVYHAVQVSRHLAPESFYQPEGWFQFGTLPFVISTFQMSGYFLVLPQWASALLFVACLAGMIGWTSPVGRRVSATMAIFILSFSIIGLRYNQYWGLVLTPLACLCAARAPVVLRDLWRSAEVTLPFAASSSRRAA
jgi:hypothetical protein